MADITYKDDRIVTYDDSWQTAIMMETKEGPFGIRVDLPVLKVRALRHDLHFIVTGPDEQGLRERALHCLETAAVTGALAGVIAAFVAPTHSWEAAAAAASAALKTCAEETVDARFEDRSHWTDWDNPFSGGGGGGGDAGGGGGGGGGRRLDDRRQELPR